ncbi:MAG: hypothetical protein E7543_04260 [Ruminococcaceae bacterium]|nr:hypothetical protein [Oscillospiraceae bacterium]
MRKITAVFLVLAIIMAVAVACGKNGDEVTTTAPIGTQYAPVTEPTTTEPSTAEASYILTTQTGQTAPWASTTRFEFTEVGTDNLTNIPTQNAGSSDYDISFNVGEIQKPNVNTSVAPATTTQKPSGTTKSEKETTNKDAEPVTLIVNSYGYGGGVIYVEVDPSNWDGNFAAASQNISIKVNGTALATSATCSVPSKKSNGIYEIKITVPEQSVNSGDVVSFTIPTGIVKNQSGSQYNLSYSSSVTV